MKVKAYDIQYDTDGEKVDLPTELIFEFPDNTGDDEISESLCDMISDQTGFCIFSTKFEKLEKSA